MTGVSEVVVDEASVNGSCTPKLLEVSTEEIPRSRAAYRLRRVAYTFVRFQIS